MASQTRRTNRGNQTGPGTIVQAESREGACQKRMFCATWGALKPSERGVWRKVLDVFRAAYRRVRGTDTMTDRDIDRLVRDSLSWAMRRDGTQ